MSNEWVSWNAYVLGEQNGRARAEREAENLAPERIYVPYQDGHNARLHADMKNLTRAIKTVAPHVLDSIFIEHRKTQNPNFDNLRFKAFCGRIFMRIGFCWCVYTAMMFAYSQL